MTPARTTVSNDDLDPDSPSDTDSPRPTRSGSARPELLDDSAIILERTFVFVDLCSFTRYTEQHGPLASVKALEMFRTNVRRLCARRGVRVAKWLGDGALLISVKQAPGVAAAVEVVDCFEDSTLRARAGVSCGRALLFDGDDYIGRPVNLAARLCEQAAPGVVLGTHLEHCPDWVISQPGDEVALKGLDPVRTWVYSAAPDVALSPRCGI